MKSALQALVLAALAALPASAADQRVYEGTWHTTNRKLDGPLTCVVTDAGSGNWKGRFYGVWQGISFDYTVPFTGSPSELHGTATIDGASYSWTGHIDETAGAFKGTFTGNRYNGYFDLKQKPPTVAQTPDSE
jgi:opacity protein-like surface antigen